LQGKSAFVVQLHATGKKTSKGETMEDIKRDGSDETGNCKCGGDCKCKAAE